MSHHEWRRKNHRQVSATVPQAAKSKIKVLEVPGTVTSSQLLVCCVLASQKDQRYSRHWFHLEAHPPDPVTSKDPTSWTSLLASESMFSSNRLQYAEEGETQVQGGCRCAVCRGVADARMPVRVGVWLGIELCSHEVLQHDHYACRISMQSLQIPCVGHTGRKRQEEDEGRECVQSGQEQAPVAELC